MHTAPGNSLLKLIVAAYGCYLIAGCGYVLSLLLHTSLWVALSVIIAGSFAWLRYGVAGLTGAAGRPRDLRLMLVAGITTVAACFIVKPHGAYDAWLHWNSLAKYMSSPAYFRMLHQPGSLWHADYPPGLPAPVALLWRLAGTDSELVPRGISFLSYLCIPLLLCDAALRFGTHRYLWLGVLALFTINVECLSQGLNQYADIPLALLLLLSLMLWDQQIGDNRIHGWFFALGLLLGGCLLMKNEGIIIATAFLTAHLRWWLRWKPALLLLSGIMIPVAVLIAYKAYIPTPNDLVTALKGDLIRKLTAPERYRVIGYYLLRFGLGRFPLFIIFFIWAFRQPRRHRGPLSPAALCLLLCATAYLGVYLTTDIGLSWLVPTSLNRLLMQLLPAAVYVAIRKLNKPEGLVPARD